MIRDGNWREEKLGEKGQREHRSQLGTVTIHSDDDDEDEDGGDSKDDHVISCLTVMGERRGKRREGKRTEKERSRSLELGKRQLKWG